MRVNSFRNLDVLSFAVELEAEVEALYCRAVVELKHLGVLPEAVQDDLGDVQEEVDAGEDSVPVLHFFDAAISLN